MAWFLVALSVLFVTAPFVQKLANGRYVDAALISLVLVGALLAVAEQRRALVVGTVLAVPAFIGRWVSSVLDSDGPNVFFIAAFLLFIGFVTFSLLRFILRSPRVTSEILCAGVATYLLLALLWATAYTLVARLSPGSFSGVPIGSEPLHGFDALYFSAGALTTGGFGDITPVSDSARMLEMVETITGTMYLAVLVARLVSLYCSPGPPDKPNDPGEP